MSTPKNPTKRHADPSNGDDNIITKLKKFILNKLSGIMDYFVNHRIKSLFLAAGLGLVLFICMYYLLGWSDFLKNLWEDEKLADLTRNSLSLLFLGLPTFFILWVFRTHDVRKQIDNNTFFECVRLLASKEEKVISTKVALEQLMYLRRKNPSYKRRIDSLTRGIPLEKANLYFAQLYDINLFLADLTGTYLTHANLSGANLTGADLTDTNLCDTILADAKLYGTNLKKALYCATAIFEGARYDETTEFPPDFDPEEAGCIKDPVIPYSATSVE